MNSSSVNCYLSPEHLPFFFLLLLLSLVRNGLLHAWRTVATHELLLAEAIPPGFDLGAGVSLALKVHLGNVINGRI